MHWASSPATTMLLAADKYGVRGLTYAKVIACYESLEQLLAVSSYATLAKYCHFLCAPPGTHAPHN